MAEQQKSDIVPMNAHIETPRLRLTRLTDTSTGSEHLQLFHEHWNDVEAVKWSLHGQCKTMEESQEWMKFHMSEKMDNMFYCVRLRDVNNKDGYGEHVGSIGLRLQGPSPTFPLPDPVPDGKTLYFRVVGYSFFAKARGNGYCTEAGLALLDAYQQFRNQFNDKEVSWLEGIVDGDNPESINVLTKLGFKNYGKFKDVEPVFLAGKWRDDGYLVYGRYA